MYISSWKILLLLPLLSGNLLTLAQDGPPDADYDDKILNGKPVKPPHSRPYHPDAGGLDGLILWFDYG
ncbi:unnamed protein product, partial [Allacma fusca]